MPGERAKVDLASIREFITNGGNLPKDLAQDFEIRSDSGIISGFPRDRIWIALERALSPAVPGRATGGASLIPGDSPLTSAAIVADLNDSGRSLETLRAQLDWKRRGRYARPPQLDPTGLTNGQLIWVALILIAAFYPFLPPAMQANIQGEAGLVAAVAAVLAVIKPSS
jgi:hypothetical protein